MPTTSALLLDLSATIDTRRLLLRVPQPGDGAALCEAVTESLPELRRFLGALPWVAAEPSVEASETWCRRSQANFLARTDLPFLMFERASGRLLGATGLHRPDWAVPRAEVGYWCRTRALGQGWVTEAVHAVTAFAFAEAGAVKVDLVTDEENLASRRVAERCGFRQEGLLRQASRNPAGELRNLCLYARLRDEAAA